MAAHSLPLRCFRRTRDLAASELLRCKDHFAQLGPMTARRHRRDWTGVPDASSAFADTFLQTRRCSMSSTSVTAVATAVALIVERCAGDARSSREAETRPVVATHGSGADSYADTSAALGSSLDSPVGRAGTMGASG